MLTSQGIPDIVITVICNVLAMNIIFFLLECPELQELRNEFLTHFLTNNPNMYKFQQLMSSQDGKMIIKLFKVIKGGFNHLQLYI